MNWTWIWVGALYVAGVFLLRRKGVDLSRRIALFFFALVLLFFFQPLTQDYVAAQDDFLNTLPPWHFMTRTHESINGEMNDIPLQHTPWGHQVRESWKSLRVPLWNHLNGSGYPLLANGQSQALSPIRLLMLPLPANRFMAGEAAAKILIALTFAFLFLRGRGYSELASVTGATIFGFSGFLHSWLHFPHITTACFLPVILWLVDRIADTYFIPRADAGSPVPPETHVAASAPGHPRCRVFARHKLLVAAALIWTAILFGGHPETASHIFFLSLLYVIWIVFVEKRATWRLFLTLGGAMTVAALLSAPFLVPFLEALPKSMRYGELQVSPLERETLPYTDINCMIVLFQAHFFGRVPFEEAWGPAVAEPVGGFAGVLGIAAFFALLVHVIRRRAWRSIEFFFVLATVIVFGVINGWPLIGDAIHAVLPVVAHARFRLLFVLLMGILAAAAIDVTQRDRTPMLVGVTVVAAMLLALFTLKEFPSDAARVTALLTSARSVAVLILAVLVTLLTRFRKWAVMALLVAVIVELWSVTRGWNPPFPGRMMYPKTPLIAELEKLRDSQPPNTFRIIGSSAVLYPNVNAMFGFEEVRAHDPMAFDRYMGFMVMTADLKTGAEHYHPWFENVEASALDFLNARYLLVDPYLPAPDAERWKRVYDGIDGKIYENQRVLPRFFAVRNVILEFRDHLFYQKLREHTDWANTALLERLDLEAPQQDADFFKPRPPNAPAAVARIVEADPTSYRITATAPRWSLIVSSIPSWPGWRVVRDGKSIEPIRVNGAFIGFAVPPGTSDVRIYYSPWTWWVGCALAALGVLVLGLIGLMGRMGRMGSSETSA
ncbi:MAG TPA: YfhO family protein [Thermoanaerobaculia bacterium]|nr:YfhO family protein [Thermoanaerobaculia bacterium]